MALLSGNFQEKLPARSLQSGQLNQVTYQVTFGKTFRSIGQPWGVLDRTFGDVVEKFYNVNAMKDMQGVVFDVPDTEVDAFEVRNREIEAKGD